jgi:hypothetical protein
MGFEIGHKKMGGRAKGIPNRTTSDFRSILGDFIYKQAETLPEVFSSIKSPEKRLDLVIKLLPFVVPKVQDFSLEKLPDHKLSAILEILSDESERKIDTN